MSNDSDYTLGPDASFANDNLGDVDVVDCEVDEIRLRAKQNEPEPSSLRALRTFLRFLYDIRLDSDNARPEAERCDVFALLREWDWKREDDGYVNRWSKYVLPLHTNERDTERKFGKTVAQMVLTVLTGKGNSASSLLRKLLKQQQEEEGLDD